MAPKCPLSLFTRLLVVLSLLHAFVPVALSQTVTGDPSAATDPPAYPSTSDPSTANYLGTRLFGYTGCASDERTAINNAYYDMSTIAETAGVYSNIDWNAAAALEFFGPSIGSNAVTAERQQQIQSKLKRLCSTLSLRTRTYCSKDVLLQVQQLYPTFPVTPIRPSLWIHVYPLLIPPQNQCIR